MHANFGILQLQSTYHCDTLYVLSHSCDHLSNGTSAGIICRLYGESGAGPDRIWAGPLIWAGPALAGAGLSLWSTIPSYFSDRFEELRLRPCRLSAVTCRRATYPQHSTCWRTLLSQLLQAQARLLREHARRCLILPPPAAYVIFGRDTQDVCNLVTVGSTRALDQCLMGGLAQSGS
jgi:hypothetical protein